MVYLDKLEAHFGEGHIVKGLADLATRREHSVVLSFAVDPIGVEESSDGFLSRIWKSLTNALYDMYSASVDIIKKIPWRVLVDFGNVPEYLEAVMAILNSMATASGERLVRYSKIISNRMSDLWQYISSLLADPHTNLSTADRKKLSQAQSESSHFSRLLSTAQNIWKNIIRKISVGFLYVLTALKEIIAGAAIQMSCGFSMLMETIHKGVDEAAKRSVIKIGYSLMCSLSDLTSLTNAPLHQVKHVLQSLVRYFGELIKSLKPDIASMDMNSEMQENWMFKAGFGAFFDITENVFTWIIGSLSWLMTTFKFVTTLGLVWLKGFYPAVVHLISQLFGSWMTEVSEVVNKEARTYDENITKAHNVLSELVKSKQAGDTRDAQKALDATQSVYEDLITRENNYIEGVRGKSTFTLFNDYNVAADLLTKLYYEESIDENDIDALIYKRTGFKTKEDLIRVYGSLDVLLSYELVLTRDTMLRKFEKDGDINGDISETIDGRLTRERFTKEIEKSIKKAEAAVAKAKTARDIRQEEVYALTARNTREWKTREQSAALVALSEGFEIQGAEISAQEVVSKAYARTIEWELSMMAPFEETLAEAEYELEKLEEEHDTHIDSLYWKRIAVGAVVGTLVGLGVWWSVGQYFPSRSQLGEMIFLPLDFETKKAGGNKSWMEAFSEYARIATEKLDSVGKMTGVIGPDPREAINIPALFGWAIVGGFPYLSSLLAILSAIVRTGSGVVALLGMVIMGLTETIVLSAFDGSNPLIAAQQEFEGFGTEISFFLIYMITTWMSVAGTIFANRLAAATAGLSILIGCVGIAFPATAPAGYAIIKKLGAVSGSSAMNKLRNLSGAGKLAPADAAQILQDVPGVADELDRISNESSTTQKPVVEEPEAAEKKKNKEKKKKKKTKTQEEEDAISEEEEEEPKRFYRSGRGRLAPTNDANDE